VQEWDYKYNKAVKVHELNFFDVMVFNIPKNVFSNLLAAAFKTHKRFTKIMNEVY